MTTWINGLYSPLLPTQIRLLRLTSDQDALESGQLEIVSLADAPPFYAVSHAWNKQGRDVEVHADTRRLKPSVDLAACIQRLQELSVEDSELDPPPKHVWIDTICINQDDLPERSMQVGLMGKIYRQSIRTLVWLGSDKSASAAAAWKLVDSIHAVFRAQNPTAKTLSDIPVRLYEDDVHNSSGLPQWDDDQWAHLTRLMSLRWFSRTWAIQEVVLSQREPTLILGKSCYPWDRLGWAATWLRRSGYLRLPQIPEQLRNVDTISNLRRTQARWPIDALMSITQIKFNATDQRDKIYGLLGLAAECQDGSTWPEELKPDYSLDVTTIYQRVARYILKSRRSLAVLTRARGLSGTETRKQRLYDLDLPSWCPDWSDFNVFNSGISTSLSWVDYADISKPAKLGFSKQYAASSGLEFKVHDTELGLEDISILKLSGFRVDEVIEISPFAIDKSGGDQSDEMFDARMAQVLELAISHVPVQDTFDWISRFIQTTTARQHSLSGKDVDQSFADGVAWLHSLLLANPNIASLFITKTGNEKLIEQLKEVASKGKSDHYVALVRNYCFDRAFVTTSAGRMGIVPSNTRQGDTISIIPGGGVPYCIRSDGKHWSFIGESYIDGLMAGEAVANYQQGIIPEEVLSFR